MSQFSVSLGGICIPGDGYEAAWSIYEERILTKYVHLQNLMEIYNPKPQTVHNCKVIVLLLSHANCDEKWWLVRQYPEAVRKLLTVSPEEWKVENLFLAEQLGYLAITA